MYPTTIAFHRLKHTDVFSIIGLLLITCFCGSYGGGREFKGKIFNRNGEPIVNGLVYIEAYRPGKGVFDFGYAVLDEKSAGTFSIRLKWKKNALIAIALFSPGMKTGVTFDRIRYYMTHGLLMTMDSLSGNESDCATSILGLGFPFENNPSLAKRLLEPGNLRIVEAFTDDYISIFEKKCPSLSGNQKKIQAVKDLIKKCPLDTVAPGMK